MFWTLFLTGHVLTNMVRRKGNENCFRGFFKFTLKFNSHLRPYLYGLGYPRQPSPRVNYYNYDKKYEKLNFQRLRRPAIWKRQS